MILSLREQFAVEFIAFRQLGRVDGTGIQPIAARLFEIDQTAVGNKVVRVFYAVVLQRDGYIGMAIVAVKDIHQDGVPVSFPVNDNAFQVNQAVLYVVIEHQYGEQVVGAAAKVGIENNGDRLPEGMRGAVTNALRSPRHKSKDG